MIPKDYKQAWFELDYRASYGDKINSGHDFNEQMIKNQNSEILAQLVFKLERKNKTYFLSQLHFQPRSFLQAFQPDFLKLLTLTHFHHIFLF